MSDAEIHNLNIDVALPKTDISVEIQNHSVTAIVEE